MANNKRIQILRGTKKSIEEHKNAELLEGQLLYNKDTKELKIGTGETIADAKGLGVSKLISDKAESHVNLIGDTLSITGHLQASGVQSTMDWVYHCYDSQVEDGNDVGTDGTNYYYWNHTFSCMYKGKGSSKTWEWDHSVTISGSTLDIGTDGTSTYFSPSIKSGTTYKFDSSSKSWYTVTTPPSTNIVAGRYIWNTLASDGTIANTYYSNGETQLKLNANSTAWETQEWTGIDITQLKGDCVGTDGTSYYCNKYRLEDSSTNTWVSCDTGLTESQLTQTSNIGYAYNGLSKANETYYSNGYTQLKLNPESKKFEQITWSGSLNTPKGLKIWKGKSGAYSSVYHLDSGKQYDLQYISHNIGESMTPGHMMYSEGIKAKEVSAELIDSKNVITDFTSAGWKQLLVSTPLEFDSQYQLYVKTSYTDYAGNTIHLPYQLLYNYFIIDDKPICLGSFTLQTGSNTYLIGADNLSIDIENNIVTAISAKLKGITIDRLSLSSVFTYTELDAEGVHILYRKIR